MQEPSTTISTDNLTTVTHTNNIINNHKSLNFNPPSMAKLPVLAAFLLLALIAVGRASATRTITTTTIVEDDETKGQCEQMSMQKMMPCMTYLQDMTRQTTGGDRNPMSEQLESCCSQLENMEEQCRCESLEMMLKKQKEKGEFRGQQMQKMMQEAMQIPGKCGMKPKQCQFHMLSLYAA